MKKKGAKRAAAPPLPARKPPAPMAAPAPRPAAAAPRPFPVVLGRLALAGGLLLVPFTVHLEIESASRSLLGATVPLVDVFLWGMLAAILVTAILIHRRLLPLDRRLVSFEMAALLMVAGLSLLGAGVDSRGLSEWLQWLDAWLLWYAVFSWAVRDRRLSAWVRFLPGVAAAAFSVAGWGQLVSGTPAYAVRSLFRDHQSYVAAVVLLAPLAWTGLPDRAPFPRGLAPHALVGFLTAGLGSVAATVLISAELLAVAWLAGGGARRPWPALASILVFTGISIPWAGSRLVSEPVEWFSVEPAARRFEVLAAREVQREGLPEFNFGLGDWRVFVESNLGSFRAGRIGPVPERPAAESARVAPEYFAECWSALRLLGDGPILGAGPGRWQARIGTGYGDLPRTGTTFPNTTNGFLLLAVSTGVVGLVMWLAVTRRHLLMGWRKLRALKQRTGPGQAPAGLAAAGAWAGLAGGAVMTLFCPIPVLPLSVIWIFLAVVCRFHPAGGES